MQITKNKDYYLLKNNNGEYHLSIEEYEKLGEENAIELAEKEIDKKNKLTYQDSEIDFSKARALGFCEYGIRDFCERLNLDIDKSHNISDIKLQLTAEVFLDYTSECDKLFGNTIELFGGAKKFLGENRTIDVMNYIIRNIIDDKINHKLAVKFALDCIDIYEQKYPNDDRPRKAIEAKQNYINGDITLDELSAAESAAWSAAESAARSAAYSAKSAAESAARSAAESAAYAAYAAESAAYAAESAAYSAKSAAWSAARSAWSAAERKQIDLVLEVL
jgi:hypothetical protein